MLDDRHRAAEFLYLFGRQLDMPLAVTVLLVVAGGLTRVLLVTHDGRVAITTDPRGCANESAARQKRQGQIEGNAGGIAPAGESLR